MMVYELLVKILCTFKSSRLMNFRSIKLG